MKYLFRGILLLCVSGCAGRNQPASYQTRAVILQIQNELESSGLLLLHERVAGFKNREGQVSSMAPMPMFFQAAPGISLRNLERGGKVKVAFQMDWTPQTRLLITAIEKLSKETVLNFEGMEVEV